MAVNRLDHDALVSCRSLASAINASISISESSIASSVGCVVVSDGVVVEEDAGLGVVSLSEGDVK